MSHKSPLVASTGGVLLSGGSASPWTALEQARIGGYLLLALTLIAGAVQELQCERMTPRPQCLNFRRTRCSRCRVRNLVWLLTDGTDYAEALGLPDGLWTEMVEKITEGAMQAIEKQHGWQGRWLIERAIIPVRLDRLVAEGERAEISEARIRELAAEMGLAVVGGGEEWVVAGGEMGNGDDGGE